MTNKQYAALLLIEAAHILKDIDEDQTTLEEGAVKSSKKHKLDNYLAKYNYKGDSKSGIITVNGKEYEIDRDTKSPIMKMPSGDIELRRTIAHIGTPNKISLGHEFDKLKNNKRRDAILNHEIGHHENHNMVNGTITDHHKDAVIDSTAKDIHFRYHDEPIELIKYRLKHDYAIPSKKESEYSDNDKRKVSNLEKFKKYETNDEHNDRIEYEADSYSSVHKNGNHLKRALRESNKYNSTNAEIKRQVNASDKIHEIETKTYNQKFPNNKIKYKKPFHSQDEIKSIIKSYKKGADRYYKQRSKALNDRTIDKSVYKEKD